MGVLQIHFSTGSGPVDAAVRFQKMLPASLTNPRLSIPALTAGAQRESSFIRRKIFDMMPIPWLWAALKMNPTEGHAGEGEECTESTQEWSLKGESFYLKFSWLSGTCSHLHPVTEDLRQEKKES